MANLNTSPLVSCPVPAVSRHSGLHISATAGPDTGKTWTLHQPRVIIGRAETAEVQLSDTTVSQFHVELGAALHGTSITDLGSRNGVRMGDVMVERGVVPGGAAFALTLGATGLLVQPAGAFLSSRSEASTFGRLLGESAAMRELFALLARLAPTEIALLIQGETGTGKELAARAIHQESAHADGPFVVLDCTALPPALATSVLFGHDKGAFTGATERRIGLIEAAHGGTLFLDEVGELPMELQPLLLRVLQEREVLPVGSTRPRPVQVRVLSATWRDLRTMVNRGAFREDLYYRLAQATVWMPPLRQRKEDIAKLVQHLLSRIQPGTTMARAIAPEALAALSARPFPGNVRELHSTVERLALLAGGETITTADLAFDRMLATARGADPGDAEWPRAGLAQGPPQGPPAPTDGEALGPFKEAKQTLVDSFERDYLVRLMDRTGNNLSRAAALANLERQNLRALLRKHGLYAARDASPGGEA